MTRFAGHLGVRAPDAPLLRHLADPDPVAQIEALAAHGFAGVADNYLLLRTEAEQARIGDAVARCGLTMGSFVHDPLNWNQPGWITGAALDTLDATLTAAARTGSLHVVCVTAPLAGLDRSNQLARMAENLARAADTIGKAGVTLCVEATHPAYAPGLLLERVADALAVVRAADHPQVRLDLDLGHVALHGEDPIAAIEQAAGLIGMVQVADVPGRVEPGAGALDWREILSALAGRYGGLVELELEPAEAGAAGERAMLVRLASLGLRPQGSASAAESD